MPLLPPGSLGDETQEKNMKSMDANVTGSAMYRINRGYSVALVKTTVLLLGALDWMTNVLDNH